MDFCPGYKCYNDPVNGQDFCLILVKKCDIDISKPVLLGFSGGPDSVCLLALLVESGANVLVAHLDHALRPGSALESGHVKKVCDQLGIHCVTQRVDVRGYAAQHHISVEEAAREVRYGFLFDEARKSGAQAVLTGHHAGDQVETVLMHFLRGSGLSGLAGMRMVFLPNPWSTTIPLVRPLLNTDREEIDDYLSHVAFETIKDESNLDPGYFRNRIRHELIPLLATYNPQINERILRMAGVAALEDDLIARLTNECLNETLLQQRSRYFVLSREKVYALHPALLRRLMRLAISTLNSTLRDIDYTVIERASQFCSHPTRSNRVDLMGGIEMFAYLKDKLVMAYTDDPLHELWPQTQEAADIQLLIPGSVRISDHWTLHATIGDRYQQDNDLFVCQLAADSLINPLIISRFRPGDRFTPYGSEGNGMKLGDFWTNAGLPARARQNWPIIRSRDEIVWVPGFRIADRVRVGDHTRKIIKLAVVKVEATA